MEKRIIYSDNATLEDASINLSNYHSGGLSKTMVASEDYLYIGSRLPFNSIYFKMGTANTNAGTLSASYWDGDQWRASVEVLDETNAFNDSGTVTFFPNRDYLWNRDHTNYNNEEVLGLGDVTIYNQYWARLAISADSSAMAFDWIGDIFCTSEDLFTEFPELASTNALTSFESGKTTWHEQIATASKLTAQGLIDKNIIKDASQVLNWRDYTLACVSKTAELIFAGFGPDYRDQMIDARNEFNSRLTKSIHRVDLNKDGLENTFESKNKTGFMSR